MDKDVSVIAIDGPTGSGKGTICRALARELAWHLLDSGALYRSAALYATRKKLDIRDPEAMAQVAAGLDVEFSTSANLEAVLLDGEDVTGLLRTERCGAIASEIASMPAVRTALLERQRAFAMEPGLVADGRDMGSVVFPNACLKVFLTASAEVRAQRRYKQLKGKGIDVSLPSLSRDIARRDERDASRQVAPLRPAKDALVLDSTELTSEEVSVTIQGWFERLGLRR
jgi:cytidylate kinase